MAGPIIVYWILFEFERDVGPVTLSCGNWLEFSRILDAYVAELGPIIWMIRQ